MSYVPVLVPEPTVEALTDRAYMAFIDRTVFSAGLHLLVERHRRRPDFPYPDTKFNPNTGQDLPPDRYEVLYTWFLGRGAEACAAHLTILDELDGMEDIREEVRSLLKRFTRALVAAILKVRKRNQGRCPFIVDRTFHASNARGEPITVRADVRGAADLFCAKGLIAAGDEAAAAVGKRMLSEFIQAARDGQYVSDQDNDAPLPPQRQTHAPFMLTLGAIPYLVRQTSSAAELAEHAGLAGDLLGTILSRHYDPLTATFSEFVDEHTKARGRLLDPGHANEFAGLGLQAIAAVRSAFRRRGLALPDEVTKCFAEAERELPRILFRSFDLGYNPAHHGIFKLVDNRTGEPVNDDMPWWSLPETARAAARVALVTASPEEKRRALEIARVCCNDYFTYYINPNNALFPYQTRSGTTGAVVDVPPAIPEGDPLYHANLAFLDMREALAAPR
ncbi:MAG: AGE family epimerase/isomerase [Anaerolineae bacterium]|nr:AGE family epimerase/isomerase [Anaerolineae bacterium]